MLEIDGSYGEGGGQILRTAVAMSSITGDDVKITKIRENRPNPGLSHQHMKAIEAVSEICDADVKGLKKGSREIEFSPNNITGGEFSFDIGTAGSITLLYQAVIPPAVKSGKSFIISVKGGTDVKWSPPYDYFEHVFLGNLRHMGIDIKSELIKRGHYPKGGGEIKVIINNGSLRTIDTNQKIDAIKGRVFVTNLPNHIAERMKKSAYTLVKNYDVSIDTASYDSASAGTGITLWTKGGKRLGVGTLGERGTPAEEVGEKTASLLIDELQKEVEIDKWCADQLIPYLSMLESSGKIKISEKTSHLKTNIWAVNQFINNKLEIINDEGLFIKY